MTTPAEGEYGKQTEQIPLPITSPISSPNLNFINIMVTKQAIVVRELAEMAEKEAVRDLTMASLEKASFLSFL